MHLLIQYPAGVIVEGLVLSAGKNRMRIAARGFADTVELKRRGEQWIAGGCDAVELEFMMPRCSDAPTARMSAMTAGATDFASLPC